MVVGVRSRADTNMIPSGDLVKNDQEYILLAYYDHWGTLLHSGETRFRKDEIWIKYGIFGDTPGGGKIDKVAYLPGIYAGEDFIWDVDVQVISNEGYTSSTPHDVRSYIFFTCGENATDPRIAEIGTKTCNGSDDCANDTSFIVKAGDNPDAIVYSSMNPLNNIFRVTVRKIGTTVSVTALGETKTYTGLSEDCKPAMFIAINELPGDADKEQYVEMRFKTRRFFSTTNGQVLMYDGFGASAESDYVGIVKKRPKVVNNVFRTVSKKIYDIMSLAELRRKIFNFDCKMKYIFSTRIGMDAKLPPCFNIDAYVNEIARNDIIPNVTYNGCHNICSEADPDKPIAHVIFNIAKFGCNTTSLMCSEVPADDPSSYELQFNNAVIDGIGHNLYEYLLRINPGGSVRVNEVPACTVLVGLIGCPDDKVTVQLPGFSISDEVTMTGVWNRFVTGTFSGPSKDDLIIQADENNEYPVYVSFIHAIQCF